MTLYYGPNRQYYEQVYDSGSTIATTIYAGGLLEKVTLGSLVDWRHYIRVGSELVAIMSRQSSGTNVTHYVLSDHEGSISEITDGSAATTVSESFSAFGTRRNPSTWSGIPTCPDLCTIASISREGYTGHDAIGGVSMGLNHMNGRVQDAITGRFLSPDPTIPNPGNTQSFNRYSYVLNNPLTMTDASGFSPCELQSCRKSSCNAQCGGDYYYAGFASGTESLSDGTAAVDDSFGSIYAPDVFDSDAGLSYSQEVTGSATVGEPFSSNNANSGAAIDSSGTASSAASSGASAQQGPAAQGQYPALDPNYFTVQSAGAAPSGGFSGTDALGAGLATYSALTDSFYSAVGIESGSFMGVRYGLPALLSDIPGGIGGAIGVFQTFSAYKNGDYLEASKAGGAALGGIAGAEAGASIGGVLGFGAADPFTIPAGAVIGGVYGAFKGSQIGGSIYNNGFQPLDSPGVPPVFPY